jgi:hypothetical protein
MLKKYTLAIATVALTFSPVAAFAGQTEVNSQDASNSAAAVGTNNTVIQSTDQTSIQNQVDVPGYPGYNYGGANPQTQINKQDASNSGAAVGDGNAVIQDIDQDSIQQQVGN